MTTAQLANSTVESAKARTKAAEETQMLYSPQLPKFKLTVASIVSYTLGILGIGILLYTGYLFFYPFKPITINSVSIVTPTVQAGGTLIFKLNSCKNTQLTPIVNRKISSSTTSEAIPAVAGLLSKGCSVREVPIHILSGTPPGSYTLYTEDVYHYSPLRDVHVYWQAGPFQVL